MATAALLCLADCTGSGRAANPQPTSADTASEAVVRAIDPDRSAPAPPIPGATTGGVINVDQWETNYTSLDPSGAYWGDLNAILSGLVIRSLTQLVYDPDSKSMVLVPDLATDTGTPNADYTQWKFTIRPGVKFEDGTPVTAQDVAYGIERSFDTTLFPTGAGAYYSKPYFLQGDTYEGPYHSGTDYPGIVVDGDTLTLKMARPFVDLPYWAAWPEMSPIPPPPLSNADAYGEHPLATGPYKIARYANDGKQRTLVLVRNQEWDPNTDPGRHQYADEFRFIVSHQATRAARRAIRADTPAGQTTVVPWAGPDVSANGLPAGSGVVSSADNCVLVEALDMRKITDIEVRRAIGYAFPYRAFYRINGGGIGPSRSLLSPGVPGSVAYDPLPGLKLGATDPGKSKALLRAAGFQPGEYRIDFPYDVTYDKPTAMLIARALTAGGFHAVAHPVGNGVYSAVRDDPNGPYNMHSFGWCPDFPDGYRTLLGQFPAKGFPDLTYLNDPDLDAKVDHIAGLPLVQQAPEWGELDRYVEDDLYPYVVRGVSTVSDLYGSRVGGLNITFNGSPTWGDLYVKH
jgi:peptide/nickel transport system substrate-binding protein